MNKILVFGSEGQVARSLRLQFPEAVFISKSHCNFEKPDQIKSTLNHISPKIIINPAGYTHVELAEEEVDRAFAINAIAPGCIADWCKRADASLIHYSTDYVFSGEGIARWTEESSTAPLNVYGASKLAGEKAILATGCHAYIFRTSWVYSPFGKNFLTTMVSLGHSREYLYVVGDQWGVPTSALDLARATLQICEHSRFRQKSGIFNVTNAGETSWHGFAERIFRQMRNLGISIQVKRVESIESSEYPTRAARPKNSRLDGARLNDEFSLRLRAWEEALDESLHRLVNKCADF